MSLRLVYGNSVLNLERRSSGVYVDTTTKVEYRPTGRINILVDTEATLNRILSKHALLCDTSPKVAEIYKPKCHARVCMTPASPGDAVQLALSIKSEFAACESAEPEFFQPAIPMA